MFDLGFGFDHVQIDLKCSTFEYKNLKFESFFNGNFPACYNIFAGESIKLLISLNAVLFFSLYLHMIEE